MKKQKITVEEFGKIIEEVPVSKFDFAITHIYISDLSDEAISYLRECVSNLSTGKILSCMVHWDSRVETLYDFGIEYLTY